MSGVLQFCSSCGVKLTEGVKFCPSCGKALLVTKPIKIRFPTALWILPIALGLIGGIIAVLVTALEYHDQWWQLLVIGIIMSGVWYLVLSVLLGIFG